MKTIHLLSCSVMQWICTFVIGVLISGCSPGMFSGNRADQGVLQTPNYRKINTACGGMKLSSVTIDVPTFRSLLRCLNSNGALEPIDKLFNGPNGLSDSDLQPIVDSTNKYILGNTRRLYQIDQTYSSLVNHGIVDNSFLQIGRILENEEFVSRSISLLKDGYWSPSYRDILTTLELVSRKITNRNWADSVDLGLRVSDSRAFHRLVSHFRDDPMSRSPSLEQLTESLFSYLKEAHTYKCDQNQVEIKKELVHSISNGELFQVLDKTLGTNEEDIRVKVPKLVAILHETLRPDKNNPGHAIMNHLSSAFRELNDEIVCMKGSNKIPNGAMHLFRELNQLSSSISPTQYFLRDLPLTLTTVKPFCTYPQSLARYYPSLAQLARSGAMDPLTELLRTFYSVERPWRGCDGKGPVGTETYHPLAQLLINFLGDSQDGYKHLIPTLIELSNRDTLDDFLLVSTLPVDEDKELFQDALRFIVQPMPELEQKSISDVLLQSITPKNYIPTYKLIASMKPFINSKETLLFPVLWAMRNAYYVNNVHPFLDLVRDITADAPKNTEFYKTLFLIADRPEFLDSVKLLSTMAKDGRLKELTTSVVALFHKFAASGKDYSLHETLTPPFIWKGRHNLAGNDLAPFSFDSSVAQKVSSDCDSISLDFSIDKTSEPQFEEHLQKLLKCQNGTGPDNDLSTSIQFLRKSKTESGKSYFDFSIDLMNQLFVTPLANGQVLTSADIGFLVSAWNSSFDDGRFFRLMNSVPFWVDGLTPPSNPVLKPLLDVTSSIIEGARTDLQELETYFAKVVEGKQSPKLLGDLDDLLSRDASPSPPKPDQPDPTSKVFTQELRGRVKKWVDFKECSNLSDDPRTRSEQINKRTEEIIQEAKSNLTNWDLVPGGSNQPGKPRQSWDLDSMKAILEPVLHKLGTKEESLPEKWVLDSILNVLRYFALPAEVPAGSADPVPQYRPADLLKWLHERSIDYRPITYFYPGETTPRVRLVNTLDMLELVLIDADFQAPPPVSKNLGLEYIGQIGDAWGDLADRKKWPKEIQDKYPDAQKPPMTLAQAVDSITKSNCDLNVDPCFDSLYRLTDTYVGLVKLPGCHKDIPGEDPDPQAPTGGASEYMSPEQIADLQVRLYNIWQTVGSLKENTPGSGVGFNGGLEVLRNLLFEVNASTPPEFRVPTAGEKNNLSMIMRMIRMGIFRQIGRILQNFEVGDPALNDFFSTLVHATKAPHLRDVAISLVSSDPQHELIWKMMAQIFHVIDHGTQMDLLRMKQLGFYSLPTVNRLERWDPPKGDPKQELLDLVLWRADGVIKDYGGFLKTQDDLYRDLLASETLSSLFRATYENPSAEANDRIRDILKDFLSDTTGRPNSSRVHNAMEILKSVYGKEGPKSSWKTFLARAQELIHSEPYKTLQIKEAVIPILRFIEQRDNPPQAPLTPEQKELSDKLRVYLAKLLKEKDLDQLLLLAKNNPNEFYHLLETLSKYTGKADQGDLKDFLRMVRRSLSEPAH